MHCHFDSVLLSRTIKYQRTPDVHWLMALSTPKAQQMTNKPRTRTRRKGFYHDTGKHQVKGLECRIRAVESFDSTQAEKITQLDSCTSKHTGAGKT